MVSDTPSLSVPLMTLLARAASCMSRRICSMRSACDSSSRPLPVSLMPRVSRSNSRTPKSDSSEAMRWEIAGWVALSFSAAARKPPSVATQKNVSILRRSIMAPAFGYGAAILAPARRHRPANSSSTDRPMARMRRSAPLLPAIIRPTGAVPAA
ncbi:hypothetical protein D9M72_137820 [compost metagenome]